MNNTTKINENPEPNDINLGEVKIYEPELGNKNNVIVQLNIPIRFYLYGRREMSEYKRIALEHLRNNASSIFEHVALLGFLAENSDMESSDLHGVLDCLGNYGKGLMEASEIVEMDFKRYGKKNKKPVVIDADSEIGRAKDVAVDEPESESLAASLSNILNNPNLPVNIYNGLVNGLDEAFNALPNDANRELSDYQNSPEYLAKLIKLSEVKR